MDVPLHSDTKLALDDSLTLFFYFFPVWVKIRGPIIRACCEGVTSSISEIGGCTKNTASCVGLDSRRDSDWGGRTYGFARTTVLLLRSLARSRLHYLSAHFFSHDCAL